MQGPLANGIRGRVGNVIFQMVNGQQIVRAMPASIHDPRTYRQLLQREAFTQAVIEWRALTVEERGLWDFWAYLQGTRGTYENQRRVDGCPKPENGTLMDGHNGAVAQKSRERDAATRHDPEAPPIIGLQDPPPFAKTKNLPPQSVQVLLSVGSLQAGWNPAPDVNQDGLWWYFNNLKEPTEDSLARVWVQPPYPIHRQRIASEDDTLVDPWTEIDGVEDHDGFIWAWHLQVGAAEVRIITPEVGGPPWVLTTPFVWKYQHDMLDGTFQSTKGGAVNRMYLPDEIGVGLWQVWPSLVQLLPV